MARQADRRQPQEGDPKGSCHHRALTSGLSGAAYGAPPWDRSGGDDSTQRQRAARPADLRRAARSRHERGQRAGPLGPRATHRGGPRLRRRISHGERLPDLPDGDDGHRRAGDGRVDDGARRGAPAGSDRRPRHPRPRGDARTSAARRRTAPARRDPPAARSIRVGTEHPRVRRAHGRGVPDPPSGAARGGGGGGVRRAGGDPALLHQGATHPPDPGAGHRRLLGVGAELPGGEARHHRPRARRHGGFVGDLPPRCRPHHLGARAGGGSDGLRGEPAGFGRRAAGVARLRDPRRDRSGRCPAVACAVPLARSAGSVVTMVGCPRLRRRRGRRLLGARAVPPSASSSCSTRRGSVRCSATQPSGAT